MSAIAKNTSTQMPSASGIISNEIKSYENDPFVVKKVNKAKETLKRVGLPKSK
ncbi:hypothetical protein [Mucilaginibacter flavus]|uniref:hypothetical protein n=1 Tax=Mucilaginibacter flavus TaxID=931504 RepID=UPI0025B568D9|nr:hypothetical protein [Mucilaginibacter flavus]MDN3582940.1 hypothetical protein [Mucilaginibacter flavus]